MVVAPKAGEAPVKPIDVWANKTQKLASLIGLDSPLFGATTITLPPRPPEHPQQAAAATRARQPAVRAPSALAFLRRPPTGPARPSPQVSHPLRSNAEAARRPGHRPELQTGGGGPLRTVDSTRRWPPVAGATTEARWRGYSWRHYHFSSRRPPARAPRSLPALSPLCYNSRCSALAVSGTAVA